ncbi:MAG: PQQ-dependent sugar dehydrogenase [Acidobacteriia bacterium]|nr:PQQ-dependent sugar dehydrogenase [Terriglobia bacterium]
MKLSRSRPLQAVSPVVAFAACLAWTALSGGHTVKAQETNSTAPPAPAPPTATPAAGAPQGAGGGQVRAAGRGRGRAPVVDTLGQGPWDLKSELVNIHVTVVTKGLDHPWGLAILPDGDMLVTERPGRLRMIRKGVLDPTPIGWLPEIRAAVLGGLMDIALHPKFAENHLIYFTYSKPGKEDAAHAATAVARGRWDGGSTLADVKDIFVADYFGGQGAPRGCCGQGPSDGSYGSRLVFDRAGFLYVTIGDRNYGELAQDSSSNIGKIVRLRDDGTVPPDNPFVGESGYRPEIYTVGHRNPLGLTIHPVTGEIWETEFGPRGGDELNRIQGGKNYGWIKVTKGEHYNGEPSEKSLPGMEEPVLYWVPVINPGNPIFYKGDRFRCGRATW